MCPDTTLHAVNDDIPVVPPPLPPTVAAALDAAATRFGDDEAVVDGDLRLSYRELLERVDEAARALIGSGVEPGDRVAIWAPNSARWVVAASAVHRCGAVLVPLNTRYKGAEAEFIVSTARARLLFTVTDFLGTDYAAMLDRANVPSVEQVVALDGPARAGVVMWDELLTRTRDVADDAAAERAAAIDGDDVCDILFTSGTTGAP